MKTTSWEILGWMKHKLESRLLGAAAAAAKSLQLCPTLCDPTVGRPPGSAVPGILQARTLEWVAIFFSNAWKWKVKVKLFSRVRHFATPWIAAYQAPPSMGFSRQEYWSALPLPSPIARRNINNLRYADGTSLMVESEELKSLLMKVKEEWKSWLKLNIQKTKIMASSHAWSYIFPFLLCFSLLFFSQLFVRPPQTPILLFCIFFPWVWSWSLSPVQCHRVESAKRHI